MKFTLSIKTSQMIGPWLAQVTPKKCRCRLWTSLLTSGHVLERSGGVVGSKCISIDTSITHEPSRPICMYVYQPVNWWSSSPGPRCRSGFGGNIYFFMKSVNQHNGVCRWPEGAEPGPPIYLYVVARPLLCCVSLTIIVHHFEATRSEFTYRVLAIWLLSKQVEESES